jgi:hypothetical protein
VKESLEHMRNIGGSDLVPGRSALAIETREGKSLRHLLVRGLLVVALALGGAVVMASPSQASARPPCDYVNTIGTRAISPEHGDVTTTLTNWPMQSGTPSRGSLDCYVNQNASAAAVKSLQTTINLCYIAPDRISDAWLVMDGVYGAKTRHALKEIQRREGVVADGVWGPGTGRTMLWRTNKGTTKNPRCWSAY